MNNDWLSYTQEQLGDQHDRFAAAVIAAIGIHLFILFGIVILPAPSTPSPDAFDVTLVLAEESLIAEDAVLEAEQNQQGSGNTDKLQQSTLAVGQQASSGIQALTGELGQANQSSIAEWISTSVEGGASNTELLRGVQLPPGVTLGDGGSDHATWVHGEQRHLLIGPTAKKGAAVEYRDRWRRWMTVNGNAFYPAEAKRRGLTGEVLTQVTIDASGAIHDVSIVQSSGKPLLDAAVLQTTRSAKWFLPFPESLREETDRLVFLYSWRYGG